MWPKPPPASQAIFTSTSGGWQVAEIGCLLGDQRQDQTVHVGDIW